jgi:peptidoglycan/LPS O-acetylase OafA/YrhL
VRGVLKHRADIDGLRAVAVLPVVAYHAGLSQTPGGFVGVDVFFVISGYLITGIVAEELARSSSTGGPSLSLAGFYERRIRRIFPALFGMLALTAVAVSILLTPAEVIDYAWTMLAAVFSGSNVLFWLDTNYFEQAAHQKPLLHTWSLSVEEQFYLFMPIGLLLLWRWQPSKAVANEVGGEGRVPLRVKLVILAVAIVSFLWSWWGSQHQPTASFYLLHTRAWELALGALLAVGAIPALRARWARELTAAIGLIAIGASVLLLTAEAPFPGVAALAPCLGTAALLHAGSAGPTLVGRLLSLKPMQFFGLISYSLYLWHWPVIVLQRASFFLGENLDSKIEKALMIALSVLFAWLSYKLIEQPFRGRSWLSPGGRWLDRRQMYAAGAIGAATLSAVSALLILSGGFPARMSAQANQTAAFLTQSPLLTMKDPTCMAGIGLRDRVDAEKCLTPLNGKKNVLLLGDSHAAHLWSGLAAVIPEANLMQATAGGCRPTWPSNSKDVICNQLLSDIYERRLESMPPELVILAARWEPSDVGALEKTLVKFRQLGIPVVVLGPVPRYDQLLPRLLIASEQRSDSALPQRHRMGLVPIANSRLAKETADKDVPYISLYDALCTTNVCQTRTPTGAPLQYDGGHLTVQGSAYVGGLVQPQLKAILSTSRSNQR